MTHVLAGVSNTLDEIRRSGLYKGERTITTPQRAHIEVVGGETVLNMCANNYLGLADHPESSRRRRTASTTGDTVCRRSDSFAARRRFTSN